MIISETNKMSAKNNGICPYVANERNKTAYMRNLHISPHEYITIHSLTPSVQIKQ